MSTATKRNSEKAKPVQELRLGRVKCAVWANETDKGVRHNVTFQRIFVGDDGQWQTSSSFGRDDLPLVAKIADMAHTWIFQNAAADANGRDAGDRETPY